MIKRPRILLTGGTGFLGQHVLPLLKAFADVTCISRSTPNCLRADLTAWDAQLDLESLAGSFDILVHMAGLYDLRAGHVESLRQNCAATHTAMVIAQKARIPHVVHVSTVAVTMNEPTQPVLPDQLTTSKRFPDHYAMSKAHGEHLVRFWPAHFDTRLILRPGILVGDTSGNAILRIDGPYQAPWGLSKVKPLLDKAPAPVPMPGKHTSRIPIVPVDIMAKAISSLTEKVGNGEIRGTKALNLAPKEGTLISDIYNSSLKHLDLEKCKLVLMDGIPNEVSKRFAEYTVGIPREELEYLLRLPDLEESETRKLLGENWCPPFSAYENAFWDGYEKFVSNR